MEGMLEADGLAYGHRRLLLLLHLLLLPLIVCCCHIPFMVFIVCGNSCCLNYAKFTPQPNIESQQQPAQSSPVHWQPMPNIINIIIVSISFLAVIIVVVTAALPAILVIFK